MALTPEQQAELNKLTLEQIEQKKKLGELNDEELAYLEKKFTRQQRTLDNLRKEIESYDQIIERLNKSSQHAETDYVRKLREQEIGNARLARLEKEQELLEKMVLTGVEMTEEQQKQYETLKKLESTRKAMQKAGKKNNDLLNYRSETQIKIEESVARVFDMAQQGSLAQGLYKGLEKVLDDLASKGFNKLKSSILDFITAYDEAITGFEKTYQLGPAMTRQIQGQYEEYAELGATITEVSEAYGELATQVTDFTMMTEAEQTALSDVAIVLQEQGVAFSDMASGMQSANKFFGMGAEEMGQNALDLRKTAEQLGRSPAQLAEEFAKAAPSLAKFGEEGVAAFKDLSRVSKITGMDMDKILSMTNRFDTFEGAAEQAGKLNAALGGNMVNAMDLMTETDPAERFGMIRDAIEQTGLSYDEMSYYQKQYFAEAAGLDDVSDLALMMSGNMDALELYDERSADQIREEEERAREMQTIQENFQRAMSEIMVAMMPIVEQMSDFAKILGDNAETVALIVKGLFIYKGIMIAMNTIMAVRNMLLLAGLGTTMAKNTADAVQLGLAQANAAAIGAMATVVTTLTTAEAANVAAATGFVTALGSTATAAGAATPAITAFGVAALKATVPLAVFFAGLIGFVYMAAKAPWERLATAGAIMVAVGFGIAKGGTLIAAGLMAFANPKVILGAVVFTGVLLGMAGAMAIASDGMAKMFEAMGVKEGKMMEVAMGIGMIALAGLAMAPAAMGMIMFSAAMALFGASLWFVSGKKLDSIATFAEGMAAINFSSLRQLADMLDRVAESMESIPNSKALAITATLNAAGIAARAQAAMQATAPAGGGAAATNNTNAFSNNAASRANEQPINVNVTLELDGQVLDRRILEVQRDSRAAGGFNSVIRQVTGN